ncbi:hypothetical protein K505DRAFT_358900 [Melanomma pulvis-pyrius CBS 109.77]|uniref:Uncharacterized protein n=1 Tax=Melanomma pulvis-pyrius CBS 109.77 TaxID=1314802 RepID=A0A6A6XL83_9PLEO|nr:hypothetical protein K505DRAFT_358900 [Melanomma pulvis-pyrius CBS 109.77]
MAAQGLEPPHRRSPSSIHPARRRPRFEPPSSQDAGRSAGPTVLAASPQSSLVESSAVHTPSPLFVQSSPAPSLLPPEKGSLFVVRPPLHAFAVDTLHTALRHE